MLKTLFAITAVGTVVALSMNLEEVEKPITPVKLETPAKNYSTYCSGCHGEKMDMFVDRQWKFGNKKEDIAKSIKLGHEPEGMPAFGETLNDKDISALADYILSGIQNVGKYTGNDKPISDIFKTEAMTIKLELVAEGLDIPWGFTFLPDGDILTTDKNGKIYRVKKDKSKQEVSGGPEPLVRGQGGLLDVALDPDFAKNNFVYFSYSKFKNEGRLLATTAIMKAKLSGNQLTEQKDIFVAEPWQTTQHHYGSRMQFGKDGYLYFSVGERGNE
ncbi:MAG: PQQ-dependent sugar dehydrogenase, partial [Sphingobacteriales bacterium]